MAKRRTKQEIVEEEEARAAEEAKAEEAAKAAEKVKAEEAAKAAEEAKAEEAAKAAEKVKAEEAAKSKATKAKATKATTKTVEDILEEASNNADLKPLVVSIKRYIKTVYGTHAQDGNMVSNMNHELFVTINNILKIKEYNKFKKQFDLINKLFLVGSKDKFSPVALSRFDFHWSHGTDSRHKYSQLVEILSALANPNDRSNAAKRFNLDTISSVIPSEGVSNFIRYYNL